MKDSFKKLITIVSNMENVPAEEILMRRTTSGCRCKNIIIYILYQNYHFTFREIAVFLSKNPSSISKSYVKFLSEIDKDYKNYMTKIRLLLDEQIKE